MKKINILLFFSLCYMFSQGQISLLSTDMPAVGWMNPAQTDTNRNVVPSVNFGNKGANQVYNFASLQNQKLDSVYYSAPSTTQPSGNPQHTAVPGANLAAFFPPTTYLMADETTNFFAYDGLQATVFNSTVISNYNDYRGIDTMYKFPCTYGQNFHGNYAGSVKLLATAISSNASLLGWDSVKVYIGATYTDTIDGWGTVTTPVGTYKCLRQKRVETDSTYYYYNTSNGGPYTLMPLTVTVLFTTYPILAANPSISTTTSYAYLAKEAKGPVISFSYDSVSQPITATWSVLPPFPVAKFGADTGVAGLVTFLDSSSNATTYSWNFGDGSSVNTTASPTHTYTANGTYDVCLTVTNASGTSTICDSVHVTTVTVGINEITPSDYRIYPNPASDVIQLDLSLMDQGTLNSLSEIVIYDLLGEKMKTLPITQTTISVKDLSNGIYLIGVMDKNQNRKILGKFDVLK
jgi:PKD repeat protein